MIQFMLVSSWELIELGSRFNIKMEYGDHIDILS